MRLKALRLLGVLALATALTLVACEEVEDALNDDDVTPTPTPPVNDEPLVDAEPAETVHLTMVDIDFEPDQFTAEAGEVVEFQVTNEGAMEHSFTIDDIAASVEVSGAPRLEQNDADVDVWVQPDEGGSFTLQVDEPGEYEFYCAVPGHAEAGQVGTLTVE